MGVPGTDTLAVAPDQTRVAVKASHISGTNCTSAVDRVSTLASNGPLAPLMPRSRTAEDAMVSSPYLAGSSSALSRGCRGRLRSLASFCRSIHSSLFVEMSLAPFQSRTAIICNSQAFDLPQLFLLSQAHNRLMMGNALRLPNLPPGRRYPRKIPITSSFRALSWSSNPNGPVIKELEFQTFTIVVWRTSFSHF
jgi:hypothetical protein